MKKYYCLLKSGTDYPDMEYTIEADSKKEAVDEILKITHWGEDLRETIERSTIEEKEFIN